MIEWINNDGQLEANIDNIKIIATEIDFNKIMLSTKYIIREYSIDAANYILKYYPGGGKHIIINIFGYSEKIDLNLLLSEVDNKFKPKVISVYSDSVQMMEKIMRFMKRKYKKKNKAISLYQLIMR